MNSGMLLQKQNELLELACIASIVLNKRNSERVIATHAQNYTICDTKASYGYVEDYNCIP